MPPSPSPPGFRLAGALGVALGCCVLPTALEAQEGCILGEGSSLYVQESLPGGGTISYFSTPHFECADGVEIWADSAVAYSELGMSHLMGAVRYTDRTRELRADTARYFTNQGRLQAAGRVFVRNEDDGSQVRDGALVYLRQTAFRDVETMTVETGADRVRPRALIPPAAPDSAAVAATPPTPYQVVADRIFLRGDSYFAASGTVEIDRDSLLAFADSAEFDQEGDNLLLEGSARVLSDGTELVGRRIAVGSPGADSSRIVASSEAVLTADGILLTAPQIVLFTTNGTLERLVAMPMRTAEGEAPDSADLAQPVATLDEAELTGDSLEIVAPNEVIQRVVAVGRARSVSTARDSLNAPDLPEVARTDWLKGDTVIVTFAAGAKRAAEALAAADSAGLLAAPDTTGRVAAADTSGLAVPVDTVDISAPIDTLQRTAAIDPGNARGGAGDDNEVESVVASGGASALYRLAPSDSTSRVGVDPPALHYVVGDRITIRMVDGDVEGMQIVGQTQGVHLEPLARRVAADSVGGDTTGIPIDTSSARPDTGVVKPDTTLVQRPPRAEPTSLGRPGLPRRWPADRKEEPWRRD